MSILLIILAVLLLIALVPAWPYSRGWGYAPFGGGLGLVILIVILVLLLG